MVPVNEAPRFNTSPVSVASVDSAYAYTSNAVDPNFDAITYSLVSAPDTMTIGAATGLINWTPTAADIAVHNIQIKADDGKGGFAIQSYSLVVTDVVPGNRAPQFITGNQDAFNLRGLGGSATYQFQATALDSDDDTIDYALVGEPVGMTIDVQPD